MSGDRVSLWFTFGMVIWVGGCGWVFYRYPERLATMNKCLGWSFLATPEYVRRAKRMGIVLMAMALFSVLNEVLGLTFGWYR